MPKEVFLLQTVGNGSSMYLTMASLGGSKSLKVMTITK